MPSPRKKSRLNEKLPFREFIEYCIKGEKDTENSGAQTNPPAWRFEYDHISDNLFWHEAKVWLSYMEAVKFLARVDRDAFMLDGRRQYQAATSYRIEQEDGSVDSAMEVIIRVQEKLKLEQEEIETVEEKIKVMESGRGGRRCLN